LYQAGSLQERVLVAIFPQPDAKLAIRHVPRLISLEEACLVKLNIGSDIDVLAYIERDDVYGSVQKGKHGIPSYGKRICEKID